MDNRTRPRSQGQIRFALALGTFLVFGTWTWATEETPKQLTDDFDVAVARLQAAFPDRLNIPAAVRLGLDRYRVEAEALAKAHGPAATGFLAAQLTAKPNDARRAVSRELALVTLAALADDGAAARALTRYVSSGGIYHSIALLPVTYAPPALGLALGLEILASRDVSSESLAGAAALLRLFGGDDEAEALQLVLADQTRWSADLRGAGFKTAAAADLVALRQRLRRPAAERAAWATQDLSVWRAANYAFSRMADEESRLRYTRQGLLARGGLGTDYLRDRLSVSSIGWDELRLILWTAADQQETGLIPELAEIVAQQRKGWAYALGVLLSFGTPDALKAVKRFIPPPSGKPAGEPETGRVADAEGERRARILAYLTGLMGGPRGIVDLMTELIANPAYPPEERAAFARTRDSARLWLTPGTGGMRTPISK